MAFQKPQVNSELIGGIGWLFWVTWGHMEVSWELTAVTWGLREVTWGQREVSWGLRDVT